MLIISIRLFRYFFIIFVAGQFDIVLRDFPSVGGATWRMLIKLTNYPPLQWAPSCTLHPVPSGVVSRFPGAYAVAINDNRARGKPPFYVEEALSLPFWWSLRLRWPKVVNSVVAICRRKTEGVVAGSGSGGGGGQQQCKQCHKCTKYPSQPRRMPHAARQRRRRRRCPPLNVRHN